MSAGDGRAVLAPGLYFVATPLGNARDITLRALDILRDAEVLAAEDTRTLRHLMEIHGIPLGGRRIVAYHDHNGPEARPRLLAFLREGRSVAYASEAGTPLVADPGFVLARAAIAEGLPVTTAPGPSAVVAALTIAGLPSDRFTFAGFPPNAAGARRRFLAELAEAPGTLVLYESPKRVAATLAAAVEVLGGSRPAALCREITKKFEETRRGTLESLAEGAVTDPPRGEIVLCIGEGTNEASDQELADALKEALASKPLKEAAREVADRFGVSRRDLYQMGLGFDSN